MIADSIKLLGERPIKMPFCPPQIPQGMTRETASWSEADDKRPELWNVYREPKTRLLKEGWTK